MQEQFYQTLCEEYSEETAAHLVKIFETAKTASADALSDLEAELSDLFARERQQRWHFLKTAPSGRIHLVYLRGGIYLVTVRGFRKILWDALLDEGDMSVRDVRWVEQEHLVLFTLNHIVRGEQQKCLCCYEPGDMFLVQRPWKKDPGEDGCIIP